LKLNNLAISKYCLGTKTAAGLDKLYETLEATATPSVEASSESTTNYKMLFDKIQLPVESALEPASTPIDTAVHTVDVSSDDHSERFKTLFSPKNSTATDIGRVVGKLGQTTMHLANQTKNKLTPAVTDLASKVKKRITEMPKRVIRREDLEADVKQILFREPEALEALKKIQIAACESSTEIKRQKKKSGLKAPKLFRDDPIFVPSRSHLNSFEGWIELESYCNIEFPQNLKAEIIKTLLLAENSIDSVMESFCALESAPMHLTPELYQRLLVFTYRNLIADLTRLALELFSFIIDVDIHEESLTVLVTAVLSEISNIKNMASS